MRDCASLLVEPLDLAEALAAEFDRCRFRDDVDDISGAHDILCWAPARRARRRSPSFLPLFTEPWRKES